MNLVPRFDASEGEDGIDDILSTDEGKGWKVFATAEVFLDIPGTFVNRPGKCFGVYVLESVGGVIGLCYRVQDSFWVRYGDFVDEGGQKTPSVFCLCHCKRLVANPGE